MRMNNGIKTIAIMLAAVICMVSFNGKSVSAASAMIEFSLNEQNINKGDTFTIIMQVSATDGIQSVDLYVSYDANYMEFVSGGKYVSGSAGLLHVSASELGGSDTSAKFSLQFKAIENGNCAVNISDKASIIGADGKEMSSSSNRISVAIGKAKPGDTGQSTVTTPIQTPASSDNKLLSLKVSHGTLEPMFDSEKTSYSLVVDNSVTDLFVSFVQSDPGAVVTLQGNEGLKEGKNTVKIIVTAPDKSTKEYKLKVRKETYAETEERLKSEAGDSAGTELLVTNENGVVTLRNSYEYEIVDVDETTQIPAGYKKTSVLLYGVNVTAYTVPSNLDSDYLIMYCRNENGDCGFYQFDRQEKSLQRYTGDLVEKINASEGNVTDESVMTSEEYKSNLSQLAVIIAILVGLCVFFIIALISVILKQVKSKSKRIEDELDF